jgi:hypothetical protein
LFFPLIAVASSPTGRAPAPTKRKVNKRETPFRRFRSLRRATAVSPAAHDKLLKKFDQNFPAALRPSLDLTLHSKNATRGSVLSTGCFLAIEFKLEKGILL